jgi:hypothetical protein
MLGLMPTSAQRQAACRERRHLHGLAEKAAEVRSAVLSAPCPEQQVTGKGTQSINLVGGVHQGFGALPAAFVRA